MRELENFYNEGFGWMCRRCVLEEDVADGGHRHSRLLREGEAEGKTPRLSTRSLARWKDASRKILECPRCGATEMLPTE